MPVREQSFVERCDVCDRSCETGCLRCDRPLCADHQPAGDRRCDPCEADFEARGRRLPVRMTGEALSARTSQRFFIALAGSAAIGSVGLLGLIIALTTNSEPLVAVTAAIFLFGTLMSMFVVPSIWAATRIGASFRKAGRNLRSSGARRRARRRFLRERSAQRQLVSGADQADEV